MYVLPNSFWNLSWTSAWGVLLGAQHRGVPQLWRASVGWQSSPSQGPSAARCHQVPAMCGSVIGGGLWLHTNGQVNSHITIWNITIFLMGKLTINGHCSWPCWIARGWIAEHGWFQYSSGPLSGQLLWQHEICCGQTLRGGFDSEKSTRKMTTWLASFLCLLV